MNVPIETDRRWRSRVPVRENVDRDDRECDEVDLFLCQLKPGGPAVMGGQRRRRIEDHNGEWPDVECRSWPATWRGSAVSSSDNIGQ